MATLTEISEQVDILSDGYGRTHREGSLHYDAYFHALSDVDAEFIRRGVVSLLREKLQFMPNPAEVRAHAHAARDYERRREAVEDQRRIACLRCMDRGYVRTVNRRWIQRFASQFSSEFFRPGWLRSAYFICRREWREDALVNVACVCACRNSSIFAKQIAAWNDKSTDSKAPPPAFRNTFDPDVDCLVEIAGEVELAEALQRFIIQIN